MELDVFRGRSAGWEDLMAASHHCIGTGPRRTRLCCRWWGVLLGPLNPHSSASRDGRSPSCPCPASLPSHGGWAVRSQVLVGVRAAIAAWDMLDLVPWAQTSLTDGLVTLLPYLENEGNDTPSPSCRAVGLQLMLLWKDEWIRVSLLF